jgi:hypothetical protein
VRFVSIPRRLATPVVAAAPCAPVAAPARSTAVAAWSDPRLPFLTGVALTLLGVGLRPRTADADDD